jgi:hypothetical protein
MAAMRILRTDLLVGTAPRSRASPFNLGAATTMAPPLSSTSGAWRAGNWMAGLLRRRQVQAALFQKV